jgi:hypothetical protein
MHAVVGIWTVDETRTDEQRRLLHDHVIPLVEAQPGFVSGYWMHDAETGKSHTTVIFTDRRSAGGVKALVERGTRRAAQAGVTSDILTTVEVLADVQQEGLSR